MLMGDREREVLPRTIKQSARRVTILTKILEICRSSGILPLKMPEPHASAYAFQTTRWTHVLKLQAGASDEEERDRILSQLCRSYWFPLYG